MQKKKENLLKGKRRRRGWPGGINPEATYVRFRPRFCEGEEEGVG